MTDPKTLTEHGDSAIARSGEILRTEVGSGVHGIAIDGTDDHDEMGIYIEPPECVIGLAGPQKHYVTRTKPEGHRSGPGDTDLVMYSLRRYLGLAVAGNPTVLTPLFAPEASVYAITNIGAELREMRSLFLSQQALRKFLGYLDGQTERLQGRGNTRVNRPELVEQYGYDTKYASHALRLGIQALEIAEHARLTLPMPEADRDRVRAMKTGCVATIQEALAEIAAIRSRLVELLDDGIALPASPNVDQISAWSVSAHQRHWAEKARLFKPYVADRTRSSLHRPDTPPAGRILGIGT